MSAVLSISARAAMLSLVVAAPLCAEFFLANIADDITAAFVTVRDFLLVLIIILRLRWSKDILAAAFTESPLTERGEVSTGLFNCPTSGN